MRDPLLVRASELRALFTNLPGRTIPLIGDPVFTLDARLLYGSPLPGEVTGQRVPRELAQLNDALSAAFAILATLLENERTQDPEGIEAARQWAQAHQNFGKLLADHPTTSSLQRVLTLLRFLADLGEDLLKVINSVGLSQSDYEDWVRSRAGRDIAQLPYLGRMREVIHVRLLNAQTEWKVNDLIDVLYLPCAAGYADFVVCERETGTYLKRVARDRSDGAGVCTSIRELLAALGC